MGNPQEADRPTILVVDDEPVVRAVCKAVLESAGFQALIAADGREGLEVYREFQPRIDLILSDVSMPHMNGLEMAHHIFAENPRANVILMTGFQPEFAVPDVLRNLCAVIAKPFQSTMLVETIRKCLNQSAKDYSQPVA